MLTEIEKLHTSSVQPELDMLHLCIRSPSPPGKTFQVRLSNVFVSLMEYRGWLERWLRGKDACTIWDQADWSLAFEMCWEMITSGEHQPSPLVAAERERDNGACGWQLVGCGSFFWRGRGSAQELGQNTEEQEKTEWMRAPPVALSPILTIKLSRVTWCGWCISIRGRRPR